MNKIDIQNTPDTFDNACKIISDNLKFYMKNKGLTQQMLSSLCEKNGTKVSQATLSNILRGTHNCSLNNMTAICNALEITLSDLVTPRDTLTFTLPASESILITSPMDKAFKGYLGNYQVYFYPTTGKSNMLLHGTLTFTPSEVNPICLAKLNLFTGKFQKHQNQTIELTKSYTGQLVISPTLNAAYCFLYSSELGELCFLIFHHFYLLTNPLKCIMANAITMSSGSNRRPTMHRMCLSDLPIPDQLMTYIKGQLLLNDSEILISERGLEKFKQDPLVPEKFISLLHHALQNESYYSITEAKLTGSDFHEDELAKLISLLRTYSEAPRYNKISRKTDDFLYDLLKNNGSEK